jgi:predicted ATP-grasp superfamily ATP-dependent carboligase
VRVFLYEYLCGGGRAAHPGAGSLRAEGLAMLSAVLDDFARVEGAETLTLVDADCAAEIGNRSRCRVPNGPEADGFRELARWADYTLVIAPESDGLLETRCRWTLEAGGRLLGPSVEAVRLAGDKRLLAGHLGDHGIPTPALLHGRNPGVFPVILKPRHGAGSQATFLVRGVDDLTACLAGARAEGEGAEILLQPFVPGQPASAALLIGPRGHLALPPAAQHMSGDGRFRYQGGTVPLAPDLAGRAADLAARAVATVPGLFGYVGVDLVLGEASDGSQDQVIEINPRLTTSYVGLRALALTNLAEAMLRMATGAEVPNLNWRAGTVRFRADGTILQHVFREPSSCST